MTGILVDTGFLVALFRPAERLRSPARSFLRDNAIPLLTAAPVIVEACFFLDALGKCRLLEWIERGAVSVVDVPVSAYLPIRSAIRKYADRDIDFADAAIVWLAEHTGCRSILTVDIRDSSVFRMSKGKRFELLAWQKA